MSEATYNCKIGFMDFFFNYPKLTLILTITYHFDTPSKGVVHHTKLMKEPTCFKNSENPT